jgi:hypothetical protein
MYIMVKTYQNLELLAQESTPGLSILESRKNNRANLCLAEDYNLRSTPKRMACAAKQAVVKRGLRKSSSLTNGMSLLETKVGLESMTLRPEVLFCLQLNLTCLCTHPGTPLTRTVLR